MARRLGRILQPRDTLARISADLFAVILVSENGSEQIVTLADKIRRSLSTPVTFANREIALSVSVGIALFDPQWHPKREDMLKDAEIAMRYAKRDGGGRIEVFRPSMRSQGSNRQALESELRRALERDEIKLFFQPVVRLEDRTVAGFDTVLRWQHPRLGRIEPSEFIPLAEETGLICDLGLFALQRAARELAAWQKALDVTPPIFVTVNVSSRQMLRHDLLADVKNVLAKIDILPFSLKLELSESLVMENPEFAAQILGRIKDLGVGLALDDFGAGYSSLAYLQRFPSTPSRSTAPSPVRKPRATALDAALYCRLAHDFGMEAVAEGAESKSDGIEFSQIGCEYAQVRLRPSAERPRCAQARRRRGRTRDIERSALT